MSKGFQQVMMSARLLPLLAGLLLAGTAGAQSATYGSVEWLERFADFEGQPPARLRSNVEPGSPARTPVRGLGIPLYAPAASDELAAVLAVEPPPVSRETLEGTSETLHSYHAVPGGIVLGLVGRAWGGLEGEVAGARIERGAGGELELALASGRRLRCPEIRPELLRACLAFTSGGRDSLVDITVGIGGKPRLATAFAGGPFEELLVRLDATPHRLRPETRGYKTLIVDRAVEFEARGTGAVAEIVLTAELEVRLYREDGSGFARRAGTLEVEPPVAGARGEAFDFSAELAPLAEIAGWLGFLRRMEELDPAGIAALRSGVGFGAASAIDRARSAP